jgi:hypothetical protein
MYAHHALSSAITLYACSRTIIFHAFLLQLYHAPVNTDISPGVLEVTALNCVALLCVCCPLSVLPFAAGTKEAGRLSNGVINLSLGCGINRFV